MIIDDSVATKWLVDEASSSAALPLLERDDLKVPDLFFAEMANIMWRLARTARVGEPGALLARLKNVFSLVVTGEELAQAALELAVTFNHPAYDCFYLALAIAEDDVLITADRRFHAACAGSAQAARVQLLG